MKKKGMSHIEIVLSFLLFISAVVFIFSIFDVQDVTKFNESSLSYVNYELNSILKTDVDIFSVAVNMEKSREKDVIAVDLGEVVPDGKNVRVENYSGDILKSGISLSRNIVYVEKKDNSFLKIMIGEDIPTDEELSEKPDVNESYYVISSRDKIDIFSEKKILDLNKSYYEDYQNLKKKMKISERIDFSWSLVFSEQDFINAEREIPTRTEVSADNRREEIMRLNGKREYADYTVKVW